ncbi:hypothetical protein [Planococcus alpniumensis]|uniref:hypothetical protein n=1 Tax=Planococcus alpniumensis TaxID=2708345 RepID=UPI001B8CC4CA|nr:hypothetical protein [Planococcus sp. MSAK28401]
MSGIYLLKTVGYGVLGTFLVLQRNKILFSDLDFEYVIGGVLIIVTALEFGVNLVAYITALKNRVET